MNLYVVETPLQLLNALEFRVSLDAVAEHHLVVLYKGDSAFSLYKNLVREDQWSTVSYMPFALGGFKFVTRYDFGKQPARGPKERLIEIYKMLLQARRRRRIDRIIRRFPRVDGLIVGDYLAHQNSYMKHLLNTIHHDAAYMVDDGTDTIWVSRQRIEELKGRESQQGDIVNHVRPAGLLSRLRKQYAGWNTRPARQLNFFSCYDIEVAGNDTLIPNEYRYLKQLSRANEATDEVIFLGQPLVNTDYLEPAAFLEYMQQIARHYEGRKLVYVPHPRETEQAVKLIRDDLGLEVRRHDVPIEYVFTVGGYRPTAVASFFCSALENFCIMLDEDIELRLFRIPERSLQKKRDEVIEIYDYFEKKQKANFRVFPLAEITG